jgi:DASH complex subunit ASK1
MATQNQGGIDDSFGSSNSSSIDSMDDEGPGGIGTVQPFALLGQGDAFEDDSFDDDLDRGGPEEETLFGVPPHQRQQNQARDLQLHGEDLLQDTMGLSQHRVEESPTPWISQRG